MPSAYYYIDIDLKTGKFLGFGTTPFANHTGDTTDSNVHRVFLTKGQYNKLEAKAEIYPKP
jgi:hypothetical protein